MVAASGVSLLHWDHYSLPPHFIQLAVLWFLSNAYPPRIICFWYWIVVFGMDNTGLGWVFPHVALMTILDFVWRNKMRERNEIRYIQHYDPVLGMELPSLTTRAQRTSSVIHGMWDITDSQCSTIHATLESPRPDLSILLVIASRALAIYWKLLVSWWPYS